MGRMGSKVPTFTGFIHFGAHIIPDYSRLFKAHKFDKIQDYF
jgi:hypothetical protein